MARLLGVSRSRAAELVLGGHVLVDGVPPGKSDRLLPGAYLDVELPDVADPLRVVPEVAPGMRIVYSDDDIIVVDKPVGVAAHPSVGWDGPTVVGHLAGSGYRVSTSGAPERQGIVSRLDVGTSGLMVVAASEHAYSVLKQAFRDRVPQKRYHALVQGHPDPLTGTIDAPIARSPHHDYKYCVRADGRPSITHYTTLEMFPGAALLDIKLETGRTHQIRVHFNAVGHSLAGDPVYGGDPRLAARLGLERQFLHAMRLSFPHPATGRWVEFESEYPADLAHALDVLRDS